MLMDAQNRPSFNQSLIGSGTLVSTDSIDLLSAVDNPGRAATALRAFASLSALLTGATAIQCQLIQSANSNLSSPTVVASGPVVTVLTAGSLLMDSALPDISARYIGFQYVLTGTGTAGNVTAGIVAATDRNNTTIPVNLG